jgi:hypothetical protein
MRRNRSPSRASDHVCGAGFLRACFGAFRSCFLGLDQNQAAIDRERVEFDAEARLSGVSPGGPDFGPDRGLTLAAVLHGVGDELGLFL